MGIIDILDDSVWLCKLAKSWRVISCTKVHQPGGILLLAAKGVTEGDAGCLGLVGELRQFCGGHAEWQDQEKGRDEVGHLQCYNSSGD